MTMYDRKGDELIATLEQTFAAIANHAYPRLLIVPKSFVNDDDPSDQQVTLFCPRCSEEVTERSLVAVNWITHVSTLSGTTAAPFREVVFFGDFGVGVQDMTGTLYYVHTDPDDEDAAHPVSLPLGSQEAWA